MISLSVNGSERQCDCNPELPLLWYLRDTLGLTGTKFGCGMGLCGACTTHLEGSAIRACMTPVRAAASKQVTTVEGLSGDGTHPLQGPWQELSVAQRGYCQPGQIMQAASPQIPTLSERRQYQLGHGRQHLPTRNVQPHSRRD